jgi:DNA-binding transcriptional regulator YiaG
MASNCKSTRYNLLTSATNKTKVVAGEKEMAGSQREITPEHIRKLLDVKKMSVKELADTLNVSEATVHRWLKADGPEPGGTAAAVLAALLAASGVLGASTGALGVAGVAGMGAIGGPVGLAAGALVGLAMSGYKLFKNMDSSFKDAASDNQVMRQLEHWAKSQEDLQKEIKRREALANELQEAERRIKALEKKLAGKDADESPTE